MIAGLMKMSSRFAIAAAAGLFMGGLALTPAQAADLGGDCCADLEERVAELEATTVRKGNRKVSLKLSGQVSQALLLWDDGDETQLYVVDNDSSSTRFRFTGSATITSDWSAGYNIEIEVEKGSSIAVDQGTAGGATQTGDNQTALGIRRSAMHLKSKKFGTLWWGHWSGAADDIVFINVAGTQMASNADGAFFGGGIFLRQAGVTGNTGITGIVLFNLMSCNSNVAALAFDCFGARQQVVRYDSPSLHGFVFSAAWGEDDYWDVAVRFKKEWNSVKVAFGVAYGETHDERNRAGGGGGTAFERDESVWNGSGSILHVPTGLFAHGAFAFSQYDTVIAASPVLGRTSLPDSHAYYLQLGVKRRWNSLGSTAIFGHYAHHEDQFCGLVGCGATTPGSLAAPLALTAFVPTAAEVTGSEVVRWGFGIEQWIDAAAMELYAVYNHFDADISAINAAGDSVHVPLDDIWTVMVGGRIKF